MLLEKDEGEIKKTKLAWFGVGLLSGLLVILVAFLIWNNFGFDKQKVVEPEMVLQGNEQKENTFPNITVTKSKDSEEFTDDQERVIPGEEGEDKFGNYIGNESGIKNYTTTYESAEVNWNKGFIQIKSGEVYDALLAKFSAKKHCQDKKDDESITDYDMCLPYLFSAGKFTAPDYLKDKELYLISSAVPGMGTYFSSVVSYYESGDFLYLYGNLSGIDTFDFSFPSNGIFSGIAEMDLSELIPPQTLDIPGTDSVLLFRESREIVNPTEFMSGEVSLDYNRGGIYDVTNSSISDLSGELMFTDPEYGPVYKYERSYRIMLPDGSVHLYDLIPYFMITDENELDYEKNLYPLDYSVDIIWDDGPRDDKYELGGDMSMNKCSSGRPQPCTSIVNENSWFDADKLIKIGTTGSGDNIYEMSDKKTNTYYDSIFQIVKAGVSIELNKKNGKDDYSENNYTEEELFNYFLENHPLFFWQDYNGDWRVYKNSKFQSMAECGKPVIYLYPKTTEKINVKVKPEGGFKYTDPIYPKNGWDVISTPDSVITSLADGNNYPYLFWEGYAYNIDTPQKGWVIKKEEVGEKMEKILALYGLNEKETKDFLEFWQPKLETKDFVYVSFVDQSDFDRVAPLDVDPIPDTVIRIFMDYIPLDKKFNVVTPEVTTPERIGFTLVEWGGIIK